MLKLILLNIYFKNNNNGELSGINLKLLHDF